MIAGWMLFAGLALAADAPKLRSWICHDVSGTKLETEPTLNFDAEWTKCAKPEECEPIPGLCGYCWHAISRARRDEGLLKVREKTMETSCVHASPPRPKASCLEGHCVIEPEKPSPKTP